MPWASPTPCAHPGCSALVRGRGSRCNEHLAAARRQDDQRRGNSSKRGYGSKWQKERKAYLTENPLCKMCEEIGQVTAANVVDHKLPHKGDMKLFWRRSNWQPLCIRCHSKKTASEDGGFGNPSKGGVG